MGDLLRRPVDDPLQHGRGQQHADHLPAFHRSAGNQPQCRQFPADGQVPVFFPDHFRGRCLLSEAVPAAGDVHRHADRGSGDTGVLPGRRPRLLSRRIAGGNRLRRRDRLSGLPASRKLVPKGPGAGSGDHFCRVRGGDDALFPDRHLRDRASFPSGGLPAAGGVPDGRSGADLAHRARHAGGDGAGDLRRRGR